MTYKVLWIDDQEEIVESTKLDADEYGIELDHFSNWQDAEVALRSNFDDYTAIIFDAYCKIKPSEDIKEEFIGTVLPSLARIIGEKHKLIPWYILSAGTMRDFTPIIRSAISARGDYNEECGQMLYIKDVSDDDPSNSHFLYENICKVGRERANNVVLFRHKEVFSYLGKDKLINERARKIMFKMLSALYQPEENIKFEYAGNPLRKVVEYVFRAARKIGVLTDECFDERDHIRLLDACRYLSGLTINCYNGKEMKKYKARWGNAGTEKDGSDGNTVFPSDIAMIVKNLLNYSSSDSHTYEELPYFVDEHNKELFFSYVFQLCHIIKWFGKFAEEHPDIEENKKFQKIVREDPEKPKAGIKDNWKEKKVKIKELPYIPPMSAQEHVGRSYMIFKDKETYYCGTCKLDDSIPYKSGQSIIIDEVRPNEGDDKERYPFIATKVSPL